MTRKQQKHVFVFGASGMLGRKVVYELIARGHSVMAQTRSKDKATRVLPANSRLEIVELDVQDDQSLSRLLVQADQAVSCLGVSRKHSEVVSSFCSVLYENWSGRNPQRHITLVTGTGATHEENPRSLVTLADGLIYPLLHNRIADAQKALQILKSASFSTAILQTPVHLPGPVFSYTQTQRLGLFQLPIVFRKALACAVADAVESKIQGRWFVTT